jgi:glutamyl-tRNA synthetase
VRFAPSPTGSLHIGGLRTALFNWLFARHYGGTFILRIEDTDQKRFDPTALKTLQEALRWGGLQWDEGPEVGGNYGPYIQSERLGHYQKWANWLVENGKAYKCFCTQRRLKQVIKKQKATGELRGYDRFCRNLTVRQIARKEDAGLPYVIRLKMPLDGKTVIQDMVRGEVEFDNATQTDPVLLKSDGFPTYHLAHVVDDRLMEISHIMRANEWLPSAPVHIQLWDAFGWEIPTYAHLPVMLNPNGEGKMSKREPPVDKDGNIIPVMVHDYIESGYLPQAIVNFLANTGWAFGNDVEIFTLKQAIKRFKGTHINPANSAFPYEKLKWLNGEWIRKLPKKKLAQQIKPLLDKRGYKVTDTKLQTIAGMVQERIKTLCDAPDMVSFIFEDLPPLQPEQLVQKKMDASSTLKALQATYDTLSAISTFSRANKKIEADLRALSEQLGLKAGQLFGAIRVAISAREITPPIFETMEVLGKETSLSRIKAAADLLEQ